MVHQIIFSGHVSQSVSKIVELDSVEKIYNYCEQSKLTGIKLYTDGSFFCVLEGSKDAILSLKNFFQQDKRLSDIVVLLQGDIDRPDFEDFNIGFRTNDADETVPRCFTITADSLEKALSKDVSPNTKILVRAFAKVNNIIPHSFAA